MKTVLGIYLFILLGFLSKKSFKEIEVKTLVILSTYFLQPFLTLWGIMLIPLNKELVLAPLIYLMAVFTALIFTYSFSRGLERKEKIISTLTPLIGNTGNLGIPLSYALFGEIGASVATLINLANIFFIYTFGIFFYASSKFDFKNAFKKIIKIPVIWIGILAISLNLFDVKFDKETMKILQMGAFASIVTQLLIFGIYIAEIKIKEVSFKLAFLTSFNKFVVFPFVAFLILKIFGFNEIFFKTILLEVMTPLAITNVNLASLFDLYPRKVAFLILLTTFLFLCITFIFI
ncbi:AEC family transporter [Lebetimonas sp. JS032]|uniref:AEC family transporter n=1 Tax=Lebetimonas sp. JS032 TaxID=990070 RepID=UPI000463E01D|nr:AEC family transporter [Lebetimonas sp. JS032]